MFTVFFFGRAWEGKLHVGPSEVTSVTLQSSGQGFWLGGLAQQFSTSSGISMTKYFLIKLDYWDSILDLEIIKIKADYSVKISSVILNRLLSNH